MLSEHGIFGTAASAGSEAHTKAVPSKKRKRNQRDSNGEDLTPWTASRCMRLLRPIASRIEPLRRVSYVRNAETEAERKAAKPPESALSFGPSTAKRAGDIDPVWMPGDNKNPPVRNYGGRGKAMTASEASKPKKSAQKAAAPSEILTLPTPFRARAVRHERLSAKKQLSGRDEYNVSPVVVRQQKRSRLTNAAKNVGFTDRKTHDQIWELQEGLQDGFTRLLEKTKPAVPDSRIGSRSLFGTCLKRIPGYIQLEEEWRKTVDEDDDTDVAGEVYADLENLGSSANGGWPSLREVVRAHGTYLVRQIIEERLGDKVCRRTLTRLAGESGAVPEAMELSVATARSARPQSTFMLLDWDMFPLCNHSTPFDDEVGGMTQNLRLLSSLMETKCLPLSWLRFPQALRFLSSTVRVMISCNEASSAAALFLEHILLAACSLSFEQHKATYQSSLTMTAAPSLDSTLISLVTVLTAIVLCDEAGERSKDAEDLLQYLAIRILKGDLPYIDAQNPLRIAILTGNYLLQTKGRLVDPRHITISPDAFITALDGLTSDTGSKTIVEPSASFIVGLARCCGQSSDDTSFEALHDIVTSIMHHSTISAPSHRSTLQQLALRAAMDFAKTATLRQSHIFALEIEATVLAKGEVAVETPSRNRLQLQTPATRKGFRWEDGLCEWIKATPLPVSRQLAAIPDSPGIARPSPIAEVVESSDPLPAMDEDGAEEFKDDGFEDSGYASALGLTAETPLRSGAALTQMDSPDVLMPTPLPRRAGKGKQKVEPRVFRASVVAAESVVTGESDSEVDELAMSCRKGASMSKKMTAVASDIEEESGDELGF